MSYPRGRRAATMVAALSMAGLSVAACTSAGIGTAASSQPHPFSRQDPLAARTQAPASATVVLPQTSADGLAAGVAQQLFRSAPVVVVGVDTPVAVTAAAAEARRIYAPLLLTAPVGSTSPRPAVTPSAAARSAAAPAAASAHPVPSVPPRPAAPPGPQPDPPPTSDSAASHPAAPAPAGQAPGPAFHRPGHQNRVFGVFGPAPHGRAGHGRAFHRPGHQYRVFGAGAPAQPGPDPRRCDHSRAAY